MRPLIELKRIGKTYPALLEAGHPVLKEINLRIYPEEQVAIMGASGSGKSTLLNIIGLLDTPSSGEYFLNGNNVMTLTDDERANMRNQFIGFVFQSFYLLPRLTILENVELPLYYRKVSSHEKREKALAMLERVGLAKYASYQPNQLSGGQQQRVAIARALITQSAFIIADEPTGALDTTIGQVIMDMFAELNQKDRVTIIIVTHDSNIASQCQRILRIHDGKFSDYSHV